MFAIIKYCQYYNILQLVQCLNTALAKRVYECNVQIEWEKSRILKPFSNVVELFAAEELQIFTGNKNGLVINDSQRDISKAWKFALQQGSQYNIDWGGFCGKYNFIFLETVMWFSLYFSTCKCNFKLVLFD